MQEIVDAVLVNVDEKSMRDLVLLKREAEALLDEIRQDLEAVRPRISFLDRINLFQTTETERREKQYLSELREQEMRLRDIHREIRHKVISAIDRTYSVRLKLHMSDLIRLAGELKSAIGADPTGKQVKGKKELISTMKIIDEELSDRFGFGYGPMLESDIIDAIVERILK